MNTILAIIIWLGSALIIYSIIRAAKKAADKLNEEHGDQMRRDQRLRRKKYGWSG